jgi:hypothetical protein
MRRLVLVVLLAIAARVLPAQSCTTSGINGNGTTRTCTVSRSTPNPTSYTNPMLLELNVSGSTNNGMMTHADYAAGRSPAMAMTLSVRGNRSWVVTASGPATWTGVGPIARLNKPVSDLQWSLSSAGAGTPLSVTPATVFSGDAGPGVSRTIYWYTLLSWTGDPPGEYNIEVTLTLTAP